MDKTIHLNAPDLQAELQWLRRIIDTRLKLYFGQETEFQDILEIPPPEEPDTSSPWSFFLKTHQPSIFERLAILLALIPHLDPHLLDVFFTRNASFDRPFTEFGGRTDSQHRGFLPTGETLLFLLTTNQLNRRFTAMQLFHPDHYFTRENILSLERVQPYDPAMTGILTISEEYLARFTHGQLPKPVFGTNFPAQLIETSLEWQDLVLNPQTRQQIQEIETWIEHGNTLRHDWGMNDKTHPGFRALFYGSSGTGKKLTASLLGKTTGREVYRINLPTVLSKYIGETEKNVAKIFQQAESNGWILFFDEADALFGKRSKTSLSRYRYANQAAAFLLQHIENFSGISILASNVKDKIDDAFTRRLEAIIHFPIPTAGERLRIWQNSISPQAKLAPEVNLKEIARRFELSGGAIMNVVRFASLEALRQGGNVISKTSIQQGLRRELAKEGKVE